MLGMERQVLNNLNFTTFITTDTISIFEDFLIKVFLKKTVETCEINLAVNASPVHSVFLTGQVIEDGEQCLLSGIDITPRKFVEAELRNRMDELTQSYEQLEEYSFRNQELKNFAYISSHELQQPVRTIYNFIQILEEEYSGIFDENVYNYLDMIRNAAKRLYALINALSDFSKVGANKALSLVNFEILIKNVLSDLHAAIVSSGAVIQVGEMPYLNAYEIEMHQLFLNLIGNAIKFHKKNVTPVIRINSEKTCDMWKFSVSDNGIGISPSYYQKLFTMFQRLHIDESEYEGKGIGLAICKKIVELHRGQIWVESNQDNGVTFYFTIAKLTI
jgi:light-regulated signal transduction histidine kinase (bacteriophytochrome)